MTGARVDERRITVEAGAGQTAAPHAAGIQRQHVRQMLQSQGGPVPTYQPGPLGTAPRMKKPGLQRLSLTAGRTLVQEIQTSVRIDEADARTGIDDEAD